MRLLRSSSLLTAALVLLASAASPAYAAPAEPAAPSIEGVIANVQGWLTGLLAALATLFLTIGGIRYLTAGGDPTNVERGKAALRNAAWGYALAALASTLVGVLKAKVA